MNSSFVYRVATKCLSLVFLARYVSTSFHPYTHLHSLGRQIAVELLRLLAVLQSLLPAFASFGIHKRNLLEARMVVTTYNPHVRLLSPGPWLVGTTKVYPDVGADIVMESITLSDPRIVPNFLMRQVALKK